jgi:hypothetical protein
LAKRIYYFRIFSHLKLTFFLRSQYFITNKLTDKDVDDEYHNSVTIINRSNGLVEASFVILEDFNQVQLYLDKFLITFNRMNFSLKCYNFKGDLLHQITLDKRLEGSDISVINKELCFVLDNDFSVF